MFTVIKNFTTAEVRLELTDGTIISLPSLNPKLVDFAGEDTQELRIFEFVNADHLPTPMSGQYLIVPDHFISWARAIGRPTNDLLTPYGLRKDQSGEPYYIGLLRH